MGFRGLWKMGFKFGDGRRWKEMGFRGLWKMGFRFGGGVFTARFPSTVRFYFFSFSSINTVDWVFSDGL
jgi:hypothetical protein